MMKRIVILGAGPAGITVAETLRKFDKTSEVIIISDEPYPPYSPPAMTEYFLTGKAFHLWKGSNFIDNYLNAKYLSGKSKRVVEVDPESCRVVLLDGEEIYFDNLVLATGSRLSASVKGMDKGGLYNFKSLSAAEEIMEKVREREAKSALVIGAGFIGIEIAVLLKELGVKVTQLVRSRYMRGMLDEEAAGVLMHIMENKGIDVLKGSDADTVEFMGDPDVRSVRVRSGKILTADLMIAATGIRPNIEFLSGSGIKVNDGVVVDEFMMTNYSQIYACGDVAETFNKITRQRGVYPSFYNAVNQGVITAYNLLGMNIRYEGADRINSIKHIGIPLITAGDVDSKDGSSLVYKKGKGFIKKIFLKNGRIVGFILLNDITNAGIFKRLMDRQVDVSSYRDRLLDENFGEGLLYRSILKIT